MHTLTEVADLIAKLPPDRLVLILVLAGFALAAFAIHAVTSAVTSIARGKLRQ